MIYDRDKAAQHPLLTKSVRPFMRPNARCTRRGTYALVVQLGETMHEMLTAPSVTFAMTPFVWNTDAAIFVCKDGKATSIEVTLYLESR